jgi:hypothetical protein
VANYRYLALGAGGKPVVSVAAQTFAGTSDAGKLVALAAGGRISSSLVVVDYYSILNWPSVSAAVIKGDGSFGFVTTDNIATAAVTSIKIASAAVTAAKIADGAVGEPKIGDGAVTNAKIASNAVTATKIADGSIMPSHLAQMPSFYHQVSAELYNCWRRDSGVPLHAGFYSFELGLPTFIGSSNSSSVAACVMLGFTYDTSSLPGPGTIDLSSFRQVSPHVSDARVNYGVVVGGYMPVLTRDNSTAINCRSVTLRRRGDLAINSSGFMSDEGTAGDTANDTKNNAYICAHDISNPTGDVLGGLIFGSEHTLNFCRRVAFFFEAAESMRINSAGTEYNGSAFTRQYGYKNVIGTLRPQNIQAILVGSLNQGGTVDLQVPVLGGELVIPSGKVWAVRYTIAVKGRTNSAIYAAFGGRFVARSGASGINNNENFTVTASITTSVSLASGNIFRIRCGGGTTEETVFDIIAQLDILEI